MKAHSLWISVVGILCLFWMSHDSEAQVNLASMIGAPENSHQLPVRFGFVNLDNGNLHLEIPLYSMPYRGHPATTNTLVYDSMFWNYFPLEGTPGPEMLYPTQAGWSNGLGDFDGLGAIFATPSSSVSCTQVEGGLTGSIYLYTSYAITDSHNTTHTFTFSPPIADAQCAELPSYQNYPGNNDSSIDGYPQNGSAYAMDGSGYHLVIAKANGIQGRYYTHPNGTGSNSFASNDEFGSTPNGNTYDVAPGSIDQLGSPYPTQSGTLSISSFYPSTSTYLQYQPYAAKSPVSGTLTRTTSSGGEAPYQYKWIYIPVCTGTTSTDYCGGMWVLGSLTLPDGGVYTFTYDEGTSAGHLGKLIGIQLPTGGTISYSYGPLSCGVFCGGQLESVTDNGAATTISYSGNSSVSGTGVYESWTYYPVTVTYPPHLTTAGGSGQIQDKTVYSATSYTFTKTEYSGSSSTLRTTTTTVDNYGRPTAVKAVWAATGESHEVDYKYADDSSLSGTMVYGQVGINMVALQTEYNNGSLVRSLRTNYLQDTSTNKYVSVYNMINYPSSVVLNDANGNTVSQVQYTYDEYSASYCSQHYPKGLSGIPMLTSVTGASGHDDTNYGANFTTRGNPTTITYTGTNVTNPIVVHKCYDTLGNVMQVVDGNGNATRYSYADNFYERTCETSGITTYAFPTTITDALGHNTNTSYYSCNRAPEAVQDPNDIANSRTGTTYQFDGGFRPTCTNYPDGGQTCLSYPSQTEIDTTTKVNTTTSNTVQTLMDSFGRGVTSINDGAGVQSDTTYDAFDRVNSSSNPHLVSGSSPSDGITYYAYDALGRQSNIKKPDGNTASWSYSGNTVTFSDESSIQHISQTDSLGRLQMVKEPNGSSSTATMETDYSYDVLNDLQSVTQWGGPSGSTGARTRSFTYDGLSHLLTATNPETGTTTYTYDANGNVSTKKDARGVTISYTYEPLERLNWKHYTDGSTVAAGFGYDGNDATGNPISPATTNAIGRLSQYSIVATSAISNFSYDPMGRVSKRAGCVPGDCNYDINVIATYDYAGDMTSLTNGNKAHPITWTYQYDSASRLQMITSSVAADSITTLFQATFSSPASYGPVGMTFAWLGVNSSTNLQTSSITRTYDDLTRLVSETDKNSSGGVQYSYSVPTFSPNGNLTGTIDSVMGTNNFTYDTLSRVLTGSGFTGLNGCWSYDPFGNRTAEVFQSSACPPSGPTATASFNTNNQVSWTPAAPAGFTYDAGGNVLYDGLNNYLYDGDGRLCAVKNSVGTLTGYIYDSGGNRVGEGSLTSFSCNHSTNGFVATKGFVTGLGGGGNLTEINGSNVWQHSNIFLAGQLLATYSGSDIYFALNDRLGTKRAEISGTGCVTTYYSQPFGNGLVSSGNCALDATEIHFTGKERDSESGNDYFGARYYASSMGRMLTPDPSGLVFADQTNPQSFNLYAYVRNNPLNFTDPTGLYCAWEDGTSDDDPKDGGATKKQCKQQGGHWTDEANPCHGMDNCVATFDWNNPQRDKTPTFDPRLDPQLVGVVGALPIQPTVSSQTDLNEARRAALARGILKLTGWIPDACSGGTFTYSGREVSGVVAHSFQGVIVEHDSESGTTTGLLTEVGGGEEAVGGGGVIQNTNGTNEVIGYGGAGVEAGVAGVSGGTFLAPGSIGLYGEGQLGGVVYGGGAYVNISTMGACAGKAR